MKVNRRQFLQITGAVGALAIASPVKFAQELTSTTTVVRGNFKIQGMPKGAKVWVGTVNGVTIWKGKVTDYTVAGFIDTEFQGDEVVIRISKFGHKPFELRGHTLPADGSEFKIKGWLEPDPQFA